MEVMKLLLELSEQLQAAQGEKGQLREKVDDVDQAVAQILGEIQKSAASCSHIRWGGPGRTSGIFASYDRQRIELCSLR